MEGLYLGVATRRVLFLVFRNVFRRKPKSGWHPKIARNFGVCFQPRVSVPSWGLTPRIVSLLSGTNVGVFLSFPESKLSQGAVERRNQHWNRNWYGNPGWWRTDSDSGEEWLGSTLISRSVFCRILKNDAKKIVAQRCQTN